MKQILTCNEPVELTRDEWDLLNTIIKIDAGTVEGYNKARELGIDNTWEQKLYWSFPDGEVVCLTISLFSMYYDKSSIYASTWNYKYPLIYAEQRLPASALEKEMLIDGTKWNNPVIRGTYKIRFKIINKKEK